MGERFEIYLTRSCKLNFHTCSGTVGWPDAHMCQCDCHMIKTWEAFIDRATYAWLRWMFKQDLLPKDDAYRTVKAWLKTVHPRSTWYAPWMVHRVYSVSSPVPTSPWREIDLD